MQDLPDVDAIFVSVGGGGLISGIASYVKQKNPSIKVSDWMTDLNYLVIDQFI